MDKPSLPLVSLSRNAFSVEMLKHLSLQSSFFVPSDLSPKWNRMNPINKLIDWFRAQRSQIKSRQRGAYFSWRWVILFKFSYANVTGKVFRWYGSQEMSENLQLLKDRTPLSRLVDEIFSRGHPGLLKGCPTARWPNQRSFDRFLFSTALSDWSSNPSCCDKASLGMNLRNLGLCPLERFFFPLRWKRAKVCRRKNSKNVDA